MTYINVLRKTILVTVTCLTFNLGLLQTAFALEDAAVSQPESQTEKEDKDLNKNDQTRIDRLAQLSGKSKEEILKMRTEQNMGWGEIAKALGIKPSELGQAIRNDRKEKNAQRKLKKDERKDKRAEAKEKRGDHDDRKSEHESKK